MTERLGHFARVLVGGAALTACLAALAEPAIIERFDVGERTYVRALALGPERKALWVGTSKGAHRIDLESREPTLTLTRREGLANEYVFAIGVDARGDVWLGTNAGGATRWRDGELETFFPMHGLADFWVYAFANQGDGSLWIGTWAGANRVDPASAKFETYVDELVNEWVYGLAVDAQDRVWFGTEGGVSRFDGRRWVAWTHADGLGAPNRDSLPASLNTGLGTRERHDLSTLRAGRPTYNPSYVFSILAARDGSVWAGTWGGGASRFDGERWHNTTTEDGLAGNIVYSIVQAADGALWFGTDRGVSRLAEGRWHSLGVADGLPDQHVYALAEAPDGTLWAGSRGGVVRIRP